MPLSDTELQNWGRQLTQRANSVYLRGHRIEDLRGTTGPERGLFVPPELNDAKKHLLNLKVNQPRPAAMATILHELGHFVSYSTDRWDCALFTALIEVERFKKDRQDDVCRALGAERGSVEPNEWERGMSVAVEASPLQLHLFQRIMEEEHGAWCYALELGRLIGFDFALVVAEAQENAKAYCRRFGHDVNECTFKQGGCESVGGDVAAYFAALVAPPE